MSQLRFAVFLLTVATTAVFGISPSPHGDVHAAILALTKRIENHPQHAGLYLRRGELHRIHRDWARAEIDYRRALALEPEMAVARRAMARMFLESARPERAEIEIRAFVRSAPRDPDGWAVLARVLERLGRAGEGVSAWRKSTDGIGSRRVDLWLERTRAVARLDATAALRDLDAAAQRIGRPIAMELEALELERSLKRWDGALARVRRIASKARRKTAWILLEAEVLEQSGRTDSARRTFESVLRSVESARAQRLRAPADWSTRARSGLRRTRSPDGGER